VDKYPEFDCSPGINRKAAENQRLEEGGGDESSIKHLISLLALLNRLKKA
jgi:hypothetical protein